MANGCWLIIEWIPILQQLGSIENPITVAVGIFRVRSDNVFCKIRNSIPIGIRFRAGSLKESRNGDLVRATASRSSENGNRYIVGVRFVVSKLIGGIGW